MIQIRLNRADRCYRPGESLIAWIDWNWPQPTSGLAIELGWRTHGKGDSDSIAIEQTDWPTSAPQGQKEWSIKLPAGPWSLNGKLIQIEWYIEAHDVNRREREEVTFVLGPTQSPVELTKAQ